MELPRFVGDGKVGGILIIASGNLVDLGLLSPVFRGLGRTNIRCIICSNIRPGPAVPGVRTTHRVCLGGNYRNFVTFNNNSSVSYTGITTTEIIGPGRAIHRVENCLGILGGLPPFFTIPAATKANSRAAITTIMASPRARRGGTVGSVYLHPGFTILSPRLAMNLPPRVASAANVSTLARTIRTCVNEDGAGRAERRTRGTAGLVFSGVRRTCGGKGSCRTETGVLGNSC